MAPPPEERAGELLNVSRESTSVRAYLKTLDAEQRARYQRLQEEVPLEVRTDLNCADCDAPLVLALGRYGRFYGCTNYDKTGCRGGVSANDDGSPKGIPGNAETRAARKRLVQELQRQRLPLYELCPDELEDPPPFGFRRRYQTVCEAIGRDPMYGLPVAELNKEQCEKALEVLTAWANGPTRWDHIRFGTLFPD